jgi:hypothetical protein
MIVFYLSIGYGLLLVLFLLLYCFSSYKQFYITTISSSKNWITSIHDNIWIESLPKMQFNSIFFVLKSLVFVELSLLKDGVIVCFLETCGRCFPFHIEITLHTF